MHVFCFKSLLFEGKASFFGGSVSLGNCVVGLLGNFMFFCGVFLIL